MPNLDRFRPPDAKDEHAEQCASCDSSDDVMDMLYDELSGRYFCDKNCFLEWADAYYEEICDYYYRMNIV